MFELARPVPRNLNGYQLCGFLICTFSNPLVGAIKSKVNLIWPARKYKANDDLMKEYWSMQKFHQESQQKMEKYSVMDKSILLSIK